MAAGDLITQDWQFEFNGLLMGPGTNYDLDSVEGLDLPSVREGSAKRPSDHGEFDLTPDVLPARIIEVKGDIISTDYTQVTAMRDALAGFDGTLPLVFRLPDDSKRRVNCRVRRRKVDLNNAATLGSWSLAIMFWAPDPRIYDNTASQQSTAATTSTGGETFETWGFDLAFDTSTSGSVNCTNAGNIATKPTVTFSGPMTSPRLINTTTGLEWSSNINLAGGETLVVDFDARTLLLNGVTDRYSTFTGTWWVLEPGSNVVQLAVSAGSGTVQIDWRSAWDSVM